MVLYEQDINLRRFSIKISHSMRVYSIEKISIFIRKISFFNLGSYMNGDVIGIKSIDAVWIS